MLNLIGQKVIVYTVIIHVDIYISGMTTSQFKWRNDEMFFKHLMSCSICLFPGAVILLSGLSVGLMIRRLCLQIPTLHVNGGGGGGDIHLQN